MLPCAQLGMMVMQRSDYQIPIFLLPGLNGDPRVFTPQLRAFPSARVVAWPPPMACEPLAEYARRIASSLDPGQDCIVAGVSFGGIVAIEVARHLRAKACLVIASSRDVRGLPIAIRFLRPFASLIPPSALHQAVYGGWSTATSASPYRRRIRRLSGEERTFRRWAVQALLTWRPQRSPPCLVFQIHGDCDVEFPAGRNFAEYIVPRAGHLLTLTHAEIVNDLFRTAIHRSAA
jgi:pimeloyl-ACP methyl ester carboxylesterase